MPYQTIKLHVVNLKEQIPLFGLIVILILVFAMGGGSRADIQSLALLRPVCLMACVFGLLSINKDHIKQYFYLFIVAAAVFGITALHMIPMPPSVWAGLPGREIIVESDKVAQLGPLWRPLSMVPMASYNAFYSLFVPLSVLILGVQLTDRQRFQLASFCLLIGLFSGFWGLLQAIGPARGPLYLYEVTGHGSAVGLFANRNHQAALLACLWPMLAVYGSSSSDMSSYQGKARLWIACAAGAVIVPLLLVTGSRAGLILGLGGLVSAALIFRRLPRSPAAPRKSKKFDVRYLVAALGATVLALLTALTSRAEVFQRLVSVNATDDLRFQIWGPIARMAWKYFPVGSGIGSFVDVYQIDEPQNLLGPEYVNHAHNDWLEIYLTGGLPALVIVCVAAILVLRRSITVARRVPVIDRSLLHARLGLAIIIILSVASIGDYPLRTPSLACLFVISALWLSAPLVRSRPTI